MSIFGRNVITTVYGESHGAGVGVLINGLPAGMPIDTSRISDALSRRVSFAQPLATQRRETDFVIQSGVYRGVTTGTPLCIFLPNKDVDSTSYRPLARPSHADYTEFVRSHGNCDLRGGGYHSGRLTAPLAAAGAVVMPSLERRGIVIASRVYEIGGMRDTGTLSPSDAVLLRSREIPMLSAETADNVKKYITDLRAEGNSCGGVSETVIFGLPAGLGGAFADAVDSSLSAEIFALPSVKGVAFGDGFDLAASKGTLSNDELYSDNGRIYTKTNRCGGIVGGITNGMPVVVKAAFKPVPSISQPQHTVSLPELENTEITVSGRHDPCTVYRALPALDALCALKVVDLLITRFGIEYFKSEAPL